VALGGKAVSYAQGTPVLNEARTNRFEEQTERQAELEKRVIELETRERSYISRLDALEAKM